MKKYCFGVDVGGTTIKMGFFDTEGNVLDKWEIPTRTENGGENVLPDIAKAVKDKLAEKQIDKEEVNRYHAEFNTETTRKEESFFKACVATDIILLQFGFFLCGEEE